MPPAAPPAAPAGLPEPVRQAWALLTSGDVRGVLLTAATAFGVSGLLAIVTGIAGAHPEMTARNTVTLIGGLWAAIFGADFVAGGNLLEVSASAGLGTSPLGLTVVTALATWWTWSRVLSGHTTARTALTDAIRVAAVVAVGITLVAIVTRSGVDVASYGDLADEMGGLELSPDATVGASVLGALCSTFVVVAALLALVTLMRPALFTGRVRQASELLVAPLSGLATLALALPVVGLVVAAAVWLVGGGSGEVSLTLREWVEVVSMVVAFAGNIGLWGLSLGASGDLGVHGEIPGVGSTSIYRGLGYFTGDAVDEWGLWVTVVLTPLTLLACAFVVVRRAGARESALPALGVWVGSLLVGLPVLGRFANVHGSVEVHGIGDVIDGVGSVADVLGWMVPELSGLVGDDLQASGGAGVSLVGTTFLLTVYAAVAALVVALLTGVLEREQLADLRRVVERRVTASAPATAASPAPDASPAPRIYQVGDVVNGHQFDGTQWLPYTGPAGTPPPPPPNL
jgi:hypothetical protein